MKNSSRGEVPAICVFSGNGPGWQWYAEDTVGRVRWIFHDEEPKSFLERTVKRPRLSRIFGAFRCVRSAKRESAAAIAAHSQFSTMWTAVALRLLDRSTPLLSFSFHFSNLPTGIRLGLAKWAFSRVERFGVHSEPERERYAKHFGLPIDRFDLVLWGVRPSSVEIEDAPPLIQGRYICALGKDGRDYATLIEAMRHLPDVTLCIVALPHNLIRIEMPANVIVKVDIPREEAMNILKYSLFMTLPLETAETSCGHITIVSAMFCRKAIVATASSGIADYFPVGYGAPGVAALDVQGWVAAIRAMIGDRERRERCAAQGEEFSLRHCSHDAACRGAIEIFRKAGVPIP
jgi:glycosyltransferase involved in cell wall biosynthesis